MQTDIIYWAPDLLDVYYRGMGLQKGDSRDLSNGHWRFIVANFGAPSKFIFHGEVTRKETPARPLAGGRGGSDARHILRSARPVLVHDSEPVPDHRAMTRRSSGTTKANRSCRRPARTASSLSMSPSPKSRRSS